ncbi:MAG: hypothetical protein ACI8UO_001225 [Verrucomicrobiales bacterium]|jgi:hypothetical protein
MDEEISSGLDLFRYPESPLRRKFDPCVYSDPASFKPWLRVEFEFRCVYCLFREAWYPTGDQAFSVDHLAPKSRFPDRLTDYSNLVYACCHCNSAKRDMLDVPDPCLIAYGDHLEVVDGGEIQGLTPVGLDLIRICQLDRPRLTSFRRRMIGLFDQLAGASSEQAAELRTRYFGPPVNAPDLSVLRPRRS